MGVEFRKSGVIAAGGDDINANLLRRQIGETQWGLWGSSTFEGTREKISIGEKVWAHVHETSTSGYGGFSCDPAYNLITIDSTKRYTWSCTAKAGNAPKAEIILWCHWRSTEGGSNLSQSSQKFTVTSEPMRVRWTLPQYTNATYTVNRINLMIGISDTTENEVYFTDLKFEEGTVGTAWLPHADEIGDSLLSHGFIETTSLPTQLYKDHIETIDYIEY